MELSNEQLSEIKLHASYLLTPAQIAMLIGVDTEEFKLMLKWKKQHPATQAYEAGKLETIVAIRKQEIELAKMGSPLAIDLVNQFIIEQKQEER